MPTIKDYARGFAHKHNIFGYYDFDPLIENINRIHTLKQNFFNIKNRSNFTVTPACKPIFPTEILDLQKEIDTEITRIEILLPSDGYNVNFRPKISSESITEYQSLKKIIKEWNEKFKNKIISICNDIKKEINKKNLKIQKVDGNNFNTNTEYYIYDFNAKNIKKLGKFVREIYNTEYNTIVTRTGKEEVVEYLFIDNGVETKVDINTDILVILDAADVKNAPDVNNDTDANDINFETIKIEGLNEGPANKGPAPELEPELANKGLASEPTNEGLATRLANEGGKPKKTRRKKNKKRSSKRRHKK